MSPKEGRLNQILIQADNKKRHVLRSMFLLLLTLMYKIRIISSEVCPYMQPPRCLGYLCLLLSASSEIMFFVLRRMFLYTTTTMHALLLFIVVDIIQYSIYSS